MNIRLPAKRLLVISLFTLHASFCPSLALPRTYVEPCPACHGKRSLSLTPPNLGQFDGDYKNKRFVLYNCSASRPDFKGQTTENGGPDFGNATQSFNLRATGRPGDKLVRASLVDDGSETFSNWFNTVYVPTLSAQGG